MLASLNESTMFARLCLGATYKSLNAHYRLFRVASWLAPSQDDFSATLKKKIFFLHTVHFSPSPHKVANLLSLQKNIYALALIFFFLSGGITPPVSAEERFGCRDCSGSRNSNLIPFQARAYPKLVSMCDAGTDRDPLHYHNAAELTMIFPLHPEKTGPQKFCNMLRGTLS